MKPSQPDFNESSRIEEVAAEWTLRIDRGLSAAEQDAYTEWLAGDSRHREAMALYQWGWGEFDRLTGLQTTQHAHIDPDLLAPGSEFTPKPKSRKWIVGLFTAIPLAAAVAFAVYLAFPKSTDPSGLEVKPALELMARIEQRTLDDGSKVEINRGASIEVEYTPEFRRIYLTKGEANFEVEKDPNRPFVVNVAGVDVRAVGTVFSVKLSDDEVDVIVTEGKVSVKPTAAHFDYDEPVSDAFLEIGQRARVNLENKRPSVDVSSISDVELVKAHRWKPRLLDFDSTPLGDIVGEFNASNPIQVVLGDPDLEMVSLSSSFWSDNVEGFVRLMESSFGMKAEWRGSREIVLHKAN